MPNRLSQQFAKRPHLKVFHGSQERPSGLDIYHEDSALWFHDGDCHVYLGEYGPSFRLRYSHIEALDCQTLLDRCVYKKPGSGPRDSLHSEHHDSFSPGSILSSASVPYSLYLPAPAHLSESSAYQYNLTTRNCLATVASAPIVGERLGEAFVQICDRLEEWDSCMNFDEYIWNYCEEQGYTNIVGQPSLALACLAMAERANMRDAWIESYVHCVGQHDLLPYSPEYEGISDTTKELIERASAEMELHVAKATRALGSFLEDELGLEHLGLTKPARDHLDRFRSYLHNYYVEKMGYYPPDADAPFNKKLWTKMYHSFQVLYEYLVDSESVTDLSSTRGANGGICVMQNILAFDQRHGYTPLPHPLPLLPEMPTPKPARRRTLDTGLRSFKLTRFDSVTEYKHEDAQQLAMATNVLEPDLADFSLLKEYQRFERQRLEEKLTIFEARKVRWLLIYGVLQMVISITRAPTAVRDAETPQYPLCVSIEGCPWIEETVHDVTHSSPVNTSFLIAPQIPTEDAEDRISIHPDCEADCAEDYFMQTGSLTRQTSQLSLTATSPSKMTPPLSRTASFRSSMHSGVHALQRSVVGSLSLRGTIRSKASFTVSRTNSMLNMTPTETSSDQSRVTGSPSRRHSIVSSIMGTPTTEGPADSTLAYFDFGLVPQPMTDVQYLDGPTPIAAPASDGLDRSASDSSRSGLASESTSSNRSSCTSFPGDIDSPTTELSTSWPDDQPLMLAKPPLRIPQPNLYNDSSTAPSPSPSPSPTRRPSFRTSTTTAPTSTVVVHAGVYTPSGVVPAPPVYIPTGMTVTSITTHAPTTVVLTRVPTTTAHARRYTTHSLPTLIAAPIDPSAAREDLSPRESGRARRRSQQLLSRIVETETSVVGPS